MSRLDPERALVLRGLPRIWLTGERLKDFNGIPWVWCELANFGGNTGMYGGFLRPGSEVSCPAIRIRDGGHGNFVRRA